MCIRDSAQRDYRRLAQLTRMLRNATLFDIDCWSRVPGVPLTPGQIERVILEALRRGPAKGDS